MAEQINSAERAQTLPETSPTNSKSMLGHDSNWWNVALLVSLGFAAVAAFAVVVATFAVISAQKREAAAAADSFSRYKVGVAAQVAEARAKGIEAGVAAAAAEGRAAEANKEAAHANKGAAEANERAAEARKKAAEAEGHLAETKARAAEAEQHAAQAHASAAQAHASAAQAEARAAQANERAAALEKDAATARLEQERLKATLAWRVIPPGQATALQHGLASHPGSVNLWYTDGDPEALYLAIQFSQILTNAHWKVLPAGVNLSGIVFGIAAPDAIGPDAPALRTALHGAGIPFSTDPLPPVGFTIGATKLAGAPTLMVGSRRPAVFP